MTGVYILPFYNWTLLPCKRSINYIINDQLPPTINYIHRIRNTKLKCDFFREVHSKYPSHSSI